MADIFTLHVAATLLVALVLGGMVFFAAMFTPLIFAKLETETASGFIRQVFPVYYRVMAALSIVAALPIWYRAEAWVMAAVAALFIAAMVALMPAINRARDARTAGDQAARRRFALLHRLSVLINLAQLVAVLVVFLRLVR
jgi:hypothetical protein